MTTLHAPGDIHRVFPQPATREQLLEAYDEHLDASAAVLRGLVRAVQRMRNTDADLRTSAKLVALVSLCVDVVSAVADNSTAANLRAAAHIGRTIRNV